MDIDKATLFEGQTAPVTSTAGESNAARGGEPDYLSISAPAHDSVPTVVDVSDLNWEEVFSDSLWVPRSDWLRRLTRDLGHRRIEKGAYGAAFEDDRSSADQKAYQVSSPSSGDVWFIGDLHGDFLALCAALHYIEQGVAARDSTVVLLGDLIDDGADTLQVLARVFDLMRRRPGHVCVLVGNHEAGVSRSDQHFSSVVDPADFVEFLNASARRPAVVAFAELVIDYFSSAPRALFFPDGLLVTHGGVPHTDLHGTIRCLADLNTEPCLQDFTWTRAHPRLPRKMPNRTTKGCEFGWQDFEAFRGIASQAGLTVEWMLRGHDHVEERYAVYPTVGETRRIMTINTLSHRLGREVFGPYSRVPVVARWVPGNLPEVHRLKIPAELIQRRYPARETGYAGC